MVLLAGAGRSGTTWVQELINYRQDHRVLFEPFWPEMVNFLPPQPSTHLYLRPDDPAPYFQPHAMRILRGEFYTPWTDRTNAPGVYQRRLIKDVRANLLLKWLTTQAPSLKVVLLLRHPCAVSLSQLRTGWPSNLASQLRELTMQPALFADFLNPFVPLLEATDSAFEANVLLWAIQNYVPLKQFGLHPADLGPATGVQSPQAQILPLFYERLCTDPEAELARLFDFLELPLEPEIFAVLRKPSLTAVGAPTEIAGEAMFDAWRGKVSPPQLERALAILHHFGLDQVYNEAAMPCSAQTNGGVPFAEKAGLTPPARNGAGAETQNLISAVLPAAELDFQPTETRPTAQGCTKQTARCSAWMRQVGGTRPACCTEHLTELLFGAADLLAEYGIVHWIDCGALLGAVRQQVLMPWDHAAHMAFVDTEPSLIPFLVQSFQDAGYDVQYSPSMPDDIKVNFSATNHLHLNLYAYHRTVDGALRMSGIHTPAHWVFPASFIETMAPVTLYDRHFPAPSPVHDFLVNHRYGPGYQLVDTMQEGYYDKQISNAVD
ncbi:MAG: sulfotransferase domain-containing protein [Caldilineaceae bacterium]